MDEIHTQLDMKICTYGWWKESFTTWDKLPYQLVRRISSSITLIFVNIQSNHLSFQCFLVIDKTIEMKTLKQSKLVGGFNPVEKY